VADAAVTRAIGARAAVDAASVVGGARLASCCRVAAASTVLRAASRRPPLADAVGAGCVLQRAIRTRLAADSAGVRLSAEATAPLAVAAAHAVSGTADRWRALAGAGDAIETERAAVETIDAARAASIDRITVAAASRRVAAALAARAAARP